MQEDIQSRVDYFKKQLIGPILLTAAFEIFVQYHPRATVLVWVANAGLITYLLGRFAKHSQGTELPWVAGISGFLITVIVALFKIFLYQEIWYVFNAFTEPFIVGTILAVVTLVCVTMMRKATALSMRLKKGGES